MRSKTTLFCVLASQSTAAAIYRRGPSKQTCLIAWDRRTDSFQVGQWFKGSVYPNRGDISPDGTLLLTFLGKFNARGHSWTALSHPPFFSALAIWPQGSTWGGGGHFLSDKEIVLQSNHLDRGEPMPAPGSMLPRGLTVRRAGGRPAPRANASAGQQNSAREHGWLCWHGSKASYQLWHHESKMPSPENGFWLVVPGGERLACPQVDWHGLDHSGDYLFSLAGSLFRLRSESAGRLAKSDDILANAVLLADFSDLTFTEVSAPYEAMARVGADRSAVSGEAVAGSPIDTDARTREARRAAARKRSK